jgi:hypothetical protein
MEREWQETHALKTATPSGVPPAEHRRDSGGFAKGGSGRREEGAGEGDGADGAKCVNPAKPSLGRGGLSSVLVSFENALESVLTRYGLPPDYESGKDLLTYHEDALGDLGAESEHVAKAWTVHVQHDKVEKLLHDQDVAYVLASMDSDGYLSQGLLFVMELFDHELDLILEEAVALNELLFALYVVTLAVFFWWFLFRKTVAHAAAEAGGTA